MGGDARGHFLVARFRRCHIDPGRLQRGDDAFGMAAFAGTGAAENEREVRRFRYDRVPPEWRKGAP